MVANFYFNLPVPAGDGVGAAVDCSTAGSLRTIVCGVTPGPSGEGIRCTINIEMSNEAAAPVPDDEWAPVATFNDIGDVNVTVAAKWLRVRRSGSKTPAGTPDVHVGGTSDGTTIFSLPVTAGDGSGAAVDVSAGGPFKTVQWGGAFRGNVNVELSEDGTFFSPFLSSTTPGQQSGPAVAKWMRVTRDGVPTIAPGLPIVTVGVSAMPGGGGGGGGNAQRFTYTVGGGDGSDFMVTLPVARTDDLYLIEASLGDVLVIVGLQFPNTVAGDRTTTQFRVVATASMTAGDTIMFYIDDPT